MGKLWQKRLNDTGQSELVEVEQASLLIDRPSVVFLSGFLTNNDKPKAIAGSIKNVQELLKGHEDLAPTPSVYCWSHKGLSNLFNLAAYNTRPSSRSSDAGYDIGAAVLMPLVANNLKRESLTEVSGTPLPLEEAKKNLRNVTFFGYSAGGIVAQETYNATLRMMQGIGYSRQDAQEALKEVVLVAAGVFSRYRREKGRFTTLYLAATNDRMMRAKNWIWGTAGTLLRTTFTSYGRKKKPLEIRPVSETSLLISAPVRPTLYDIKTDTETGERQKKYFKPLYPKFMFRRSYHELQHYMTQEEGNNAFANMALYALVNALTRQRRLAPLELLAAPQQALNAETYNTKITAALAKPLK